MLLMIALLNFSIILMVFVELIGGFRKTGKLGTCQPLQAQTAPQVSIIVAACNEQAGIEQAIHAIFRQQYENFEVLVVDDRSTDKTPALLAKLTVIYPNLKVIRIDHLPDGWLGKVHAMQVGADHARGDFLLFTDADVMLEPTTLARAVGWALTARLDHLTLIFRNSTKAMVLNALIIDAGIGLFLLLKPWQVKNPQSRYFIGIGAFNLVRTSVYRAIGGHHQIKTQVVDDLFLGKRLKYAGYRQDCLFAQDHLLVPWYDDVADLVSGVMKNVFSLFHYRTLLVIPVVLLMVFLYVVPIFGILFCTGVSQWLFSASILLKGLGVALALRFFNQAPAAALFTPLTPLISLYIILKATFRTKRLQGVYWRAQFYPLEQLRKAEWLLTGFFRRGGS